MDPNPARGMPLQLQRYWLIGKGAAKIRWHMPGDYLRCVRQLRKYFPKNPEGLCNILHQKAVGAPPGKGHPGEHALVAAAQALMDMQPELGQVWAGPIAPIGRPTGEPNKTRIFEHGALSHRMLPLALAWREKTGPGHDGAVTVGRILGITYGPDHEGKDWAWAWGDWLNEDIVPQVKQARHLVQMGVAGPSVDPGGRISATVNPETGFDHMTMYTIGGATLVSIPAFAAMRLMDLGDGDWPDDDPDMVGDLADETDDCGCSDKRYGAGLAADLEEVFTVNTTGWHGLPLAPRNAVFDNDDAVKRIAAWAQVSAQGADIGKLRRAFLWRDPSQPETATTSYRLPVGDIINGRLTLIYHAIYAAAALLSGAHGGLPGVSDQDVAQLRNVISDIYPVMATTFNDNDIRAPWDRSAKEGVQLAMEDFAAQDPKEPYGDVKYADPGYQEDGKKRYPLDSEEHCRAAWSYINMPKNAAKYSPEELGRIKGRIKTALKKYGVDASDKSEEYALTEVTDSDSTISPPGVWFENPNLEQRTPLQVTSEGRVFGHLAAWNECHRDVTMKECVLAPHSRLGYRPFHLGSTLTSDGQLVRTGKITMDTGHAPISWNYSNVVRHYDDTGYEIATVRAGEDQFGIWVAGALVPEATTKQAAKLRRSPLSGDWRSVQGNLELTAALAVNFPAFPVYAMDNEERLALTAAGMVLDDREEPVYEAPPTGIIDAIRDHVSAEFDAVDEDTAEERWQRFQDIMEDEAIYAQRARAARFQMMFAMGDPVTPAPAVAPAAAPVAPGAPVPAAPQEAGGVSATDQAGDDPESWAAWQVAAEADARFSIVAEPDQETEEAPAEPVAQAPAPVPAAPVAAPAPVPAPQAPVPVR